MVAQIALHAPSFLITSNRLKDIIAPKVQKAIAATVDADMLQMVLLKSMARLLKAFAEGYFKHFDSVTQGFQVEVLNTVRVLQMDMRQKLN